MIVALFVAAVVGLAIGTAGAAASAGVALQDDGNGSDATRHEHPDLADGDGDDAAVADWLADQLLDRIEESAAASAESRQEDATRLLGDPFAERLDQYEAVAADTGRQTEAESDPRTRDQVAASEIEAVRTRQIEFARAIAEYEAALEEYEAAKERGDEDRAFELAREAVQHADEAEAIAVELQARYSRIEVLLGEDLSGASDELSRALGATSSERDRIASEAFVDTTLRVAARNTTLSPTDPVHVRGRLVDADGDPVSNATIAVSDPVTSVDEGVGAGLTDDQNIGSDATTTTRTAADGTFELTHGAVFVPEDTEQLVVEYRPERLSPYRSARARVDVSVEPVRGDVRVVTDRATVQYGERFDIGVVTSVEGRPVPGVPFRLGLENATSTALTDDDGVARLTGRVSRTVPVGERSVDVVVPLEGWSVEFDAHAVPVRVERADATLSLDTEEVDDGRVRLSGRLGAADGPPVPDAPVRLALADSADVAAEPDPDAITDGRSLGTVRTDDDGRFSTTLRVADRDGAVVASYAESRSNLGNATAGAPLPGGADEEPAASGPLGTAIDLVGRPVVLAAFGCVVLVAGGVARRRRHSSSAHERAADPAPESLFGDEEPVDIPDPLEVAEDELSSSPDVSAYLAYGVGRRALADEVDLSSDATHREFYEACLADGLDGETVGAVRTITECYETAAYAPDAVDEAAARRALAAARDLDRPTAEE